MKRRTFVKSATVLTVGWPFFRFSAVANAPRSIDLPYAAFPSLQVQGSYRQIGFRIGQHFRETIRTVLQLRKEWHSKLLRILDTPEGKRLSDELQRLTRKHFPQYLEEVEGLAEGAGLHFRAIWAITIKSELGTLEAENPGCSTIVQIRSGQRWLFHNEDGHNAYHQRMFVVQVTPPSGVKFVSLVYPGTLTGNGPSLNQAGVVQTTNYISSTRPRVGIPRYILGRAILEARSLKEAIEIATLTPRSYPYHHNLASFEEKTYASVETTPDAVAVTHPEGIYFHTNHLRQEATRRAHPDEDAEYVNSSSRSRFQVIQSEVESLRQKERRAPSDFLAILSSHRQAPYSPCRHPLGKVQGRTLGTAFFELENGVFRLYRGNPCIAVVNDFFREYRF